MFTFLPGPFLVQFSGPFYLSTDKIIKKIYNSITYKLIVYAFLLKGHFTTILWLIKLIKLTGLNIHIYLNY